MTGPHTDLLDDVDVSAFDELPLDTLEEAGGELLRRITVGMREVGELRADEADSDAPSPRRRLAMLIALTELASQTFAAAAAGTEPPSGRVDRHPGMVAAVMYGAPTVGGLLQRLEQDRRMIASQARSLDHRLAEPARGPWRDDSLRTVLSRITIAAPAACAQALEGLIARWDEEARRAAEAREVDL